MSESDESKLESKYCEIISSANIEKDEMNTNGIDPVVFIEFFQMPKSSFYFNFVNLIKYEDGLINYYSFAKLALFCSFFSSVAVAISK